KLYGIERGPSAQDTLAYDGDTHGDLGAQGTTGTIGTTPTGIPDQTSIGPPSVCLTNNPNGSTGETGDDGYTEFGSTSGTGGKGGPGGNAGSQLDSLPNYSFGGTHHFIANGGQAGQGGFGGEGAPGGNGGQG